MTICNGSPAEVSALEYAAGTLPEAEAERFEEHFFDCPVCLAYLQTVQAMGTGLAELPAAEVREPRRRSLLSWPSMTWALGAAAAVLVVGTFTYKVVLRRDTTPAVAHIAPAPAPAPMVASAPVAPETSQPQSAVKPSLLADLMLPAFIAPNLRGDNGDADFQGGMKAYSAGDCAGAAAGLERVAAASRDGRAAEFYRGACQMHLGDLKGAAATFKSVADAGDSPQQESAYYYLAQVDLAQNDAAGAHTMLKRTIALKGDLEQKASVQDRKVVELLNPAR